MRPNEISYKRKKVQIYCKRTMADLQSLVPKTLGGHFALFGRKTTDQRMHATGHSVSEIDFIVCYHVITMYYFPKVHAGREECSLD